jgi:hypothetical protein
MNRTFPFNNRRTKRVCKRFGSIVAGACWCQQSAIVGPPVISAGLRACGAERWVAKPGPGCLGHNSSQWDLCAADAPVLIGCSIPWLAEVFIWVISWQASQASRGKPTDSARSVRCGAEANVGPTRSLSAISTSWKVNGFTAGGLPRVMKSVPKYSIAQ